MSDNANRIVGAIRADLVDSEGSRDQVEPVIEAFDGVKMFTSLPAKGYIKGVSASSDALEKAEIYLHDRLAAFDYDA
jgi:hypothetical protein